MEMKLNEMNEVYESGENILLEELNDISDIENVIIENDSVKIELMEEEDVLEVKQIFVKVNTIKTTNNKPKAKRTSKWHESLENKFEEGDIIYSEHYNKYGIFSNYGVKQNRVLINLLCKNSKTKTFEKPWSIPLDSAKLVKRNDILQDGFIETEKDFKKED